MDSKEIDVGAICAFAGGLGFLISAFMHIIGQSSMELILAIIPLMLFAIYYEIKTKKK